MASPATLVYAFLLVLEVVNFSQPLWDLIGKEGCFLP